MNIFRYLKIFVAHLIIFDILFIFFLIKTKHVS